MLMSAAHAADPSLVELSHISESVEIDGNTFTAIAYPYFNRMPYIILENKPPLDCFQQGRFIVMISIKTDNTLFRRALKAERMWVVQGEMIWSWHILKNNKRIHQERIEFVARDCDAPLQVRRNSDAASVVIPANAVIELKYAKKRYLLRTPDVMIGEVY